MTKDAAPSDRLALAFIGLGSMGMRHIKGFLEEPECRIAAVCDVDASRRLAAVRQVNEHEGTHGCAGYGDFRDCIARDDIDAVVIAVPDHWHAVIAIAAARAGKDIYGEKPLALTVAEGQEMVRAVNRYGAVWQTGSWQRSTAHFRRGCELVRNGRIGKLRRVEVGIGKGHRCEAQPAMPVPEGFDYATWLGPAPWAPYTEKRCHWNFRWILDYSGGQVTDWGAHHIDIAQWGMGTDGTGPIEVAGSAAFPDSGLWDTAVTYRFACRYAHGVTLHVGSNDHYPQGVRFIGDRGWVHLTRGARGIKAYPESILKEKIGIDGIHLYRISGEHRQGHRQNWLQCIRTRGRTITPIEIGHRSATICHLANIALRTGRTIRWDPVREEIVGDPGARRMLARPMRAPWTL